MYSKGVVVAVAPRAKSPVVITRTEIEGEERQDVGEGSQVMMQQDYDRKMWVFIWANGPGERSDSAPRDLRFGEPGVNFGFKFRCFFGFRSLIATMISFPIMDMAKEEKRRQHT